MSGEKRVKEAYCCVLDNTDDGNSKGDLVG